MRLTFNQRAQRFPLRLPLLYRAIGGTRWKRGVTENISHSGILFRAEGVIALKSALEVTVALPDVIDGKRQGQILCTATVIRRAENLGNDGGASVAVAITTSRLGPAGPSPESLTLVFKNKRTCDT